MMLHCTTRGTGRPILMLHGLSLDHRYMVDILEPVFETRADWQRVYVDLPGHGQSTAQEAIRSQDDLLAAVLGFVDQHLGAQPFAVVGLSRGSYLARGLIYRMPERVKGAVLIVPGGNPSSDPARLPRHRVIEPDPSIRAELSDDEIWRFDNFSVVQRRGIVEKQRRIVVPAQRVFDAAQDDRVKAAFDFSFAADEEQLVFDGPSLIVAGRQDSISGYRDAMDLCHRFPRASLAVLDAAGHGLAWERPEVFEALFRDWLDRLDNGWPGP